MVFYPVAVVIQYHTHKITHHARIYRHSNELGDYEYNKEVKIYYFTDITYTKWK
jgi:hypothetical protein